MTNDRAIYVVLGLMLLILPLSSLLARRPSAGAIVRSLVAWAVIAGVLYVALNNRQRSWNWPEHWANAWAWPNRVSKATRFVFGSRPTDISGRWPS
ncbi:hypothetical protein ACVOMT_18515 [Sphingomonas panni]